MTLARDICGLCHGSAPEWALESEQLHIIQCYDANKILERYG